MRFFCFVCLGVEVHSVVFEYFLHLGPVLLASAIDVGIVLGELNAIVSVESILQRRCQSSLWSLK
jgi:hypothetical protein